MKGKRDDREEREEGGRVRKNETKGGWERMNTILID